MSHPFTNPVPHPNQPQANYLKAQLEIYLRQLTGLDPVIKTGENGQWFQFDVKIPFENPYNVIQIIYPYQLEAAATDKEDLATILGVFKTRLEQSRKDVQLNPGM